MAGPDMDMVEIVINGKNISVKAGRPLLETCLSNGIYIPNLCHVEGMTPPPASCRPCLIEVEGIPAPVPSCVTTVEPGMVVSTDTAAVRKLQRTALKLLLSVHDIDCRNCPVNRKCPLPQIARFLKLGLKSAPFETRLKKDLLDDRHPFFNYYPNRCVLCGRCVYLCHRKKGYPKISFAGRGFGAFIRIDLPLPDDAVYCHECRECATSCPVTALRLK